MSVARTQREVSSAEFAEWRALARVEAEEHARRDMDRGAARLVESQRRAGRR